MKSWHLGIVIALVVGYAIGVMWPSIGNTVKSKIGA
jgi:hypothetical protein